MRAILNITPKATLAKVFKFERKQFEDDHKTDHDGVLPPPNTPEPIYNRHRNGTNYAQTAPTPITPNLNSNSVPKRHYKNCSVLSIPPSPHSVTPAKSISPAPAHVVDMDSSDDDEQYLTVNLNPANNHNKYGIELKITITIRYCWCWCWCWCWCLY